MNTEGTQVLELEREILPTSIFKILRRMATVAA
jgi:hypothetical protein